MGDFSSFLATLNAILWNDFVLFIILATGVVFTLWSGFSQTRALTHGVRVLRGEFDDPKDPGAISHFQALSAALSGTVGLGNIGGVALAITLGGPGAVFWMWIVALLGMATKLTEVTLSMIHRNVDDPANPHGGPMWVANRGLAKLNPRLAGAGAGIGTIFCISLIVCTGTGGNMFQAWNIGNITHSYFGVPTVLSGMVVALIVGAVTLGGIKRIGAVTGRLVPVMVVLYLIAGCYVLAVNAEQIPGMFALILRSAFSPTEAAGAFVGGSVYAAFLFGMKRAIFSNEAGQGTSPMAHAAARTNEPVREALVAGMEPFIDTVIVCTFTALVILSTGVWNRSADATYERPPQVIPVASGVWSVETLPAPPTSKAWHDGQIVYLIVKGDHNEMASNNRHKLSGSVRTNEGGIQLIEWDELQTLSRPQMTDSGVYVNYTGAALTARAFDSAADGLGKWLVTVAAWLFGISTMIAWSYYGEQGVVYLFGTRAVVAYRLLFCAFAVVATLGVIRTDLDLDNLTGVGTAVMLFANIPIIWIFGHQAMRAYHAYIARLRAGEL